MSPPGLPGLGGTDPAGAQWADSDGAALDRVRPVLTAGCPWTVGIVGLGSVGSQVADGLARSGVRRFVLLDPGSVAAANLSRSVYRRADVGRLKVRALADHLESVAGPVHLRLVAEPTGEAPLQTLLTCDLLVLATDDPAAELVINQAAYPAGTAMISVKLYGRAVAAEMAWVAPHRRSPCLRCLTVGREASFERVTDYGTGGLAAEPALGCDIAVVVSQGIRASLSLLSSRDAAAGRPASSELAAWFDQLARQGKSLAITASTGGWGPFALLDDPLFADPWATLWVRATRRPQCLVCGAGSA